MKDVDIKVDLGGSLVTLTINGVPTEDLDSGQFDMVISEEFGDFEIVGVREAEGDNA